MTTKEIFAQRLCEIRESKNLTRQQVADDLGITRASLEYYEKGKRTPDINTINEIANYFSVSVDYLFGRTECISTDDKMRTVCDFYQTDVNTACSVRNLFLKNKNHIDEFKKIIKSSNFQAMLHRIYENIRLKSELGCSLLSELEKVKRYREMKPEELYNEFYIDGYSSKYMSECEKWQKEIDLNEYRTQKNVSALLNIYSKEYTSSEWDNYEDYINAYTPTQNFINELISEIEYCIDDINYEIRNYVDQQLLMDLDD